MEKLYDINVFMRPTLSDEELKAVTQKVKNQIGTIKGEIIEVKEPEKKRAPYEIKKSRDAYYYYIKAKADSLAIKDVSERLRLTEEVVRFMISEAVIMKDSKKKIKKASKPKKVPAAPAFAAAPEAPGEVKEGGEGAGGTAV